MWCVDDTVDKRTCPSPRSSHLRSFAHICSSYLLNRLNNKHTDGKDALPGAVECLEELRSKGKRLVILSNTSKRESFTMARLPKFGFRQELFDGGVTSGEVKLCDGFFAVCYVLCTSISYVTIHA